MGQVIDGGIVHYLYEWCKDGRVYWDTQCNIEWADRDNTNLDYRPPVSKKPVTCFSCIHYQSKVPGG